MRTRSHNPFTTVSTSGLLLPVDLLTRIIEGDPDLKGLSPQDYHLRSGERLNEAASRAWNECLAAWKAFRKKLAALPASDAATTLTRDEWLLPLFQELGYGRLQAKKAIEFDHKEYPISHGWENHVPIHLLSARYPLDRRTQGVAGAATRAPYSLLQEMLNRSAQHRWGFVSNGLTLFLLRDNAALARAANVEFDLEAMMDGELYADFMLLFLLCHQSRVEIAQDGKPEDCWLEKWAQQADSQGARAREKLRDGVETAIQSLGAGFLTTKGNNALRERLRSGDLSTQDYYRQLLRVVYRLLMLLVAEEKKTENGQNLLHPPDTTPEVRDRYARFYSVSRIRSLAYQRRGTAHTDLYQSLQVLFLKLRTGYPALGIPGMGSFLFSDDSTPDLDDALLANQDLLDAFRNLCYTEDTSGRGGSYRRPVDFGNLGSEELGSVYESLLELHPNIDTDKGPFTLGTAAGNERKTTGSYYTPTSLINCLLDSALDPVVNEAIDVPDPAEAERKLLDLKVCDPACGSGHFLIAAAERMATHLARLRTGDDQPNTLDVQHAKRDIIGRCIYGVDINPMAVELCKVSLWMEALEPGKPLSFLDHHIQCGNSLLGATPQLLAEGIPDDAFKPIEGDDKKVCAELKKDNKKECEEYQSGQGYLFEPPFKLGNVAVEFAKMTSAKDDSLDAIETKQQRYQDLVQGADYLNARFWADTWCAAFVWKKDESNLGRLCPTERKFRDIERTPHNVLPHVREEVERLRDEYQFLHWYLAFPDVFRVRDAAELGSNATSGWRGGFSTVLGNPPWERFKIQEKEWFSNRVPKITKAKNTAVRRKLISELQLKEPATFFAFTEARRHSEGQSHIVRDSDRFPLCGRGDVNTYSVFAELNRSICSPRGRVGCIVPSGIATDSTTQYFIRDLIETRSLVSLFDFENRKGLFPKVDSRLKFCLLTINGEALDSDSACDLAFYAHDVNDLSEVTRRFSLKSSEFALINPNTGTCPIFRSKMDAEITKAVYHRIPAMVVDGRSPKNSWGFQYLEAMHASHDAAFLKEATETTSIGMLRFYEAKLLHHFDHRWGTYVGNEVVQLDRYDPNAIVQTRWIVDESKGIQKMESRSWTRSWRVAWRDITNSTNERTMIAGILPRVALSHKLPMTTLNDPEMVHCLVSCWSTFILDYIARQKVAGTAMTVHYLKQFPVPSPDIYSANLVFDCDFRDWILPRFLNLTFTAWDLEEFAIDFDYDGPPFRWDEERRFQIRCELDAAYFHLYLGAEEEWGADNPTLREMFPTPRHAVDYIMDTFPIVRRKDEAKHNGDYRTKRTILEIYDQMAAAIRTGQPYQTQLNPPPGPPTDAEGEFVPFENWTEEIRSRYREVIHLPREDQSASHRKRLDSGEKIFLLRLLLRRWDAAVHRHALELALLFALNDGLRNRVLNQQPATAGAAKENSQLRSLQRMDRQLAALEKNGIIVIEYRSNGQFIRQIASPDMDKPLVQSFGERVEEALKAFAFIKGKRETDAFDEEFSEEEIESCLAQYCEESDLAQLVTL
ncbi:Eco57I restriction-modification methylase domain-containing protein [Lignipirellula cremea]|uniref:site-specific DNA-methyltransferase (adenine-specific) n=1 Tax=Lignipirellula cremea TaxID=2528010 RepID=A0A518DWP6_9BACT|nr:N-6 DNA methylase [Lignipirellula cremea]QDU96257.1 N-6 DNA Methylase [Lignipirellula cremea]